MLDEAGKVQLSRCCHKKRKYSPLIFGKIWLGSMKIFFNSGDKFIRHVFSSPCDRYDKLLVVLLYFCDVVTSCSSDDD